jgi:ATP synthase F1 complex assembly factor 2
MTIHIFHDIMPHRQPEETVEKVQEIIKSMNDWQFAALTRIAATTKSILIGLAMVETRLDRNMAIEAARLEIAFQTRTWGEMQESHDLDKEYLHMMLASASIFLHTSPKR